MKMIFISILLLSTLMIAQENARDIQIIDPARDGIEVNHSYEIKGKAEIESGTYLWALVHRIKGFKTVWWPQGECEINPETKEWEITVTFGNEVDVGYEFEIAVINIEEKEHNKLEEYWTKAMETGRWNPIKMPPTIGAPQIRKVKKVSNY
ncbi:MAG: hypothetical protein PVH88_13865 [Ignavibacteria bacterium]|jgi:hypothetical protein